MNSGAGISGSQPSTPTRLSSRPQPAHRHAPNRHARLNEDTGIELAEELGRSDDGGALVGGENNSVTELHAALSWPPQEPGQQALRH